MRTLTIAIATYQRREPVCTLVRGLAALLVADPALAEGVDVLVVVDGSDDGTKEALESLTLPVPLTVVWQANAGLATTRHRSLDLATGELIWFLDDDLAPLPETLRRHRESHESGDPHVCMGPCVLPEDADTIPALRGYYANLWAELEKAGRVERYDRFSAANTSVPVALLQGVGGFDTGFSAYGREDFELGFRLVQAGVPILFEARAAVLHHQERSVREFLRNAVGEGQNSVRLARLHPETLADMIPASYDGRSYRLLATLRVRSPRMLRGVSLAAAALSPVEARLQGRDRFSQLAYAAAFASGVAREDHDGTLVARLFSGAQAG